MYMPTLNDDYLGGNSGPNQFDDEEDDVDVQRLDSNNSSFQ